MLKQISKPVAWASSELAYRASLVKHARSLPLLDSSDRQIVETLQSEGVFVTHLEALNISSTPKLLEAVHKFLPNLPKEPPHRELTKRNSANHAVSACPEQLTRKCPELFLWGLETKLLSILENYIGLPVAYLGANLRRDINNKKQIGTRLWHRDGEDRRTIKIIVYLNNVSQDGGAFEYIPRSLSPSYRSLKGVPSVITDAVMENIVPRTHWKKCEGTAGTVVIADTTSVFHHGTIPQSDRLALFFTYTSRRPKQSHLYTHRRFSEAQLFELSAMLSSHQKNCVFWNQNLVEKYQQFLQ
jgi:hypothetical protein